MNKSEGLLTDLMRRGYSVHIEAKGAGREYPFTFEASTSYDSNLETETMFLSRLTSHGVGDTLTECLVNLTRQLDAGLAHRKEE